MHVNSKTTPNQTLQSEISVDTVVRGFEKLIALNDNKLSKTLSALEVAPSEINYASSKLRELLGGNEDAIVELRNSMLYTINSEKLVSRTKGGKTKFEIMKQWGIPYGDRLFIDHKTLGKSLDIGSLITAVTAACGPEAAPLAAALKLLDNDNGIIITQIPIGVGPCIPTPQ